MSRIKSVLLPILLLLTTTSAWAQETERQPFQLPPIMQPSPHAAALGRYGDIPVSIATGVPNITVPIYEVRSSQLTLPISLNYHASGIKVMDRATAAGMGWSLLAGGAITRAVKGVFDESPNGFYNLIFPDENDPSAAEKEKCLAAKITLPNKTGRNIHIVSSDGEPDIFYYSFNGNSGKFILKNRIAEGIDPGVMTIPYAPLKIDFDFDIDKIVITDTDGTIYNFGYSIEGESVKEITSNEHGFDPSIVNNNPHPTAWHLTEIISGDGSDTISLKYIPGNGSTTTNTSYSMIREYPEFLGTPISVLSPPFSTITVTEGLILSEIRYKEGKVKFDYEDFFDTGIKRLSTIQIMNFHEEVEKEIGKFTLYHSAFLNSEPENSLRLDSIIESGVKNGIRDSKGPYKFSYYVGPSGKEIPEYNSKAQDLWGYYNGKNNQNLVMVEPGGAVVSAASKRMPVESYLKTGTLNKILYPTGGTTEFEFEANQTTRTYSVTDTTFKAFSGIRISSNEGFINDTTFTLNVDLIEEFHGNIFSGKYYNAKIIYNVYIEKDSSGRDLSFVLKDLDSSWQQYGNVPYDAPPGSYYIEFYETLITGHEYRLYFSNPSLIKGATIYVWIDGYYDYDIITREYTVPVLTGGLRIKKITSSDGNGGELIKAYNYPKSYYNSDFFFGDFDHVATQVFYFDTFRWVHGRQSNVLAFRTYPEYPSLPIGSSSNALSYEVVEETRLDSKGNPLGKTEYTFNVAKDYLPIPDWKPLFRTDKSYIRNQLKRKRIFKYTASDTVLLEETYNTYADLGDKNESEGNDKVKTYLTQLMADNIVTPGYPETGCIGCLELELAYPASFRIDSFDYTSSKIALTSTEKTIFNEDGQEPFKIKTNYTYNNKVHMLPTRSVTYLSTGDSVVSERKYPLEKRASSCTNDCEASFIAELNAKKANLYACQEGPRESFHFYQSQVLGDGQLKHPDRILAANDTYLQCAELYNNEIAELVTSYKNCLASFNACEEDYYLQASNEEKAIIDLTVKNMIMPVLEEKKCKNDQLLSITNTIYKNFSPGNPYFYKVQHSQGANPLEDKIEVLSYNSVGKITEQRKGEDIVNSYIYDYSKMYPVAEVTNAFHKDIAYTSFEADGKGNWNFSGSTSDLAAPTGKKAYYLGSGSISKNMLSPEKTYMLSYWYTHNSVVINGGSHSNIITNESKNGWTFTSRLITGASAVNISGLGYVDELRLHPIEAQMTTYTYKPHVGVTSMTDANGNTVSYEYDGLRRLKLVKDFDGNIIKKHEYAYQE